MKTIILLFAIVMAANADFLTQRIFREGIELKDTSTCITDIEGIYSVI